MDEPEKMKTLATRIDEEKYAMSALAKAYKAVDWDALYNLADIDVGGGYKGGAVSTCIDADIAYRTRVISVNIDRMGYSTSITDKHLQECKKRPDLFGHIINDMCNNVSKAIVEKVTSQIINQLEKEFADVCRKA